MTWDQAAERAVLSVAMENPRAVMDLPCTPSDFYDTRHGELFATIQAMASAGEPIDPALVGNRFPKAKTMIAELIGAAPLLHHGHHYARIVADKAAVRRVLAAAVRIQQVAESDRSAAEIIEHARSIVDDITPAADQVRDPAMDFLETVDSLDREIQTVPSPWPELDDYTGGFRRGGLYVVGARPGVGKSLLAVNAARHAAQHGHGVSFSSLEMSRHELHLRLISDTGNVPLTRLVKPGWLRDEDRDAAATAAAELGSLPLYVDDRSKVGPIDIHARARDVSRRTPLGMVVVDYLQLIRPMTSKEQRERQVAEISRHLKLIARDLNVPVLAMAQLNRQPANRTDKRPTLTDLRESGAIEADADVVLLLHRDDDEDPTALEVIAAKNRHGPTGLVTLWWNPQYSRITSLRRPNYLPNQWPAIPPTARGGLHAIDGGQSA